jgi:dihydrofolate synthase / folylpolyglutamate synthase
VNKSNWNLNDWLSWQQTINSKNIDLSLERIKEVSFKLELSIPGDKIFLVAGTNGKGTTVSLIEDLLISKGLNVGSYTSPHLVRYNERVRYNKKESNDKDFIDAFILIESVRDNIPLTYFEYGTLAAFLLLRKLNCDYWVIEVGLGGRLDATNIIERSVSIITNIALDHQEWLGKTVEDIATEKAGIISENTPIIYGDNICKDIIENHAYSKNSELLIINQDFSINGYKSHKNIYKWIGKDSCIDSINLPDHWATGEINNLSIALMAIETSDSSYLPTSSELNKILNSYYLAGRFEIIKKKCTWVLDVAHNPNAAINLRKRFDSINRSKKNIMVLSMMKDKDIIGFIESFTDVISEWVVCRMDNERSFHSKEILNKFISNGITNVISIDNPKKAFEYVEKNTSSDDNVIVTGSFEIVGPAKEWLN